MCIDMYVDMCIDMYVDMCIDMRVDMCTDMCMSGLADTTFSNKTTPVRYTYPYTCPYTCLQTHPCTCPYACPYTCQYTCPCTCPCTCPYTRTKQHEWRCWRRQRREEGEGHPRSTLGKATTALELLVDASRRQRWAGAGGDMILERPFTELRGHSRRAAILG